MMTQRGVTLVFLLAVASVGHAEVIGRVELIEMGIDDLLGNGLFDVYHVIVENDLAPSSGFEASFSGMFLIGTGSTVQDDTELVAGGRLADSFLVQSIVFPSTISPIYTDTASLLEGSIFVPPRYGDLLPFGSSVIAVLSVPSGYVPDVNNFRVDLFIDGEFVPVNFIPEPAGLALAAMSLAGIAARRGTQPHGAKR